MKFDNAIRQPAIGHAPAQTDRYVMPGNVSIIIHDRMAPLEQQWRALEADNHNSVHQSYEWCRAWVDAYQRPLQIVEGRIDGALAFILPLEIVRGRMFTKAQFIGAHHANINTGLVAPILTERATPDLMAAIAAGIRDRIAGADCIILGNMPLNWRGHTLPFSMLPHVENQNHAFQLPVKSSFVETLAQLNAKRRRKKYGVGHRRLEALGGYEHVTADSAAEKKEFLDLFFEQKAARLAEFGLPNGFACAKTRKFLHSALLASSDDTFFPLRMHALRMTGGDHKGEIPAVAGLSRKGDHVIVQFCSIGSGPATDASPGELLFHLMIEQYNAQNVCLFDFGIGDMPFKRSWCTEETVQVNVTLPVTPLGRLAALKEETATRLKTMIKQNPAIYAFVQKLRTRAQQPVLDEKADD
ncbi:GNAT family N-acetyltransferase [Rhizobium sp. KVB221]|uniref:GNAT family N-acetyltransferase n=1 Tax=Rhizobium setariae TaxID=2801340 RepID=A0A936YRQ6_9HYPH|nr:GNAT family N-acetyltransferase [Rhizobium setariae]MBL0371352.1 GNAT family N-acetyltransferase [Rhizobium setariae]